MAVHQQDISDNEIADILQRVKTIALLGASNKPQRDSYKVMSFLLDKGYRVYPINPLLKGEKIMGCDVVASIEELPITVDMLDVFRDSKYLFDIVHAAKQANINIIWTQLGVIDKKAERLAKENNIAMVVNRCPAIEIPRLNV